jgi:hypothetical protein
MLKGKVKLTNDVKIIRVVLLTSLGFISGASSIIINLIISFILVSDSYYLDYLAIYALVVFCILIGVLSGLFGTFVGVFTAVWEVPRRKKILLTIVIPLLFGVFAYWGLLFLLFIYEVVYDKFLTEKHLFYGNLQSEQYYPR